MMVAAMLCLQVFWVGVTLHLARENDRLNDEGAALDREVRMLRFVASSRGLDVPTDPR